MWSWEETKFKCQTWLVNDFTNSIASGCGGSSSFRMARELLSGTITVASPVPRLQKGLAGEEAPDLQRVDVGPYPSVGGVGS